MMFRLGERPAVTVKTNSSGKVFRCIAVLYFTAAMGAFTPAADAPRVFLLNASHLATARERLVAGDEQLAPALAALRKDADRALSAGPWSVVSKEATPPSGDKHDYMSLAPYWWPNPNTSNGLPYVHRDGERNPEIYKSPNRRDLGELSETVETLSLAYFFTRDETYAARASLLIRTWFLDPQNRMNPNFQFAQAIRGINTGRGLGLIESRLFTKIIDSVGLIADSEAWNDEDQRGVEEWSTEYLHWMQSSKEGREEAAAENNHGTYYDIQIASFALFLGKNDLAREVIEYAKKKRIAVQIEPDGRQPLELVRTKAWGYSVGNLSGLMALARLGEHVEIDLWRYQTPDGRSIRAALDYLIPFGLDSEEWPYQQIGGFSAEAIRPLVLRAANTFPDGAYQAKLSKGPPLERASRMNLLERVGP